MHLEPVRAAGGEKKGAVGETGAPSGVEGVTLQTDLNGEFLFPKVLPGGYFVIVEMPGYLSARAMFTDKEIEDPSPEMRQLVGRALNRVQVETGHTERVQVRMERGSAVSGTVHFDDGSPAIGVPVKLLKKGDKGSWEEMKLIVGGMYWGKQTDDRGQFRIAGFPQGTYLLETDLSLVDETSTSVKNGGEGETMQFVMAKNRFTLAFYGSGQTRQSEAAPFTVGAGQEREGEDLVIPLAKLHRVTGTVVAKRDGHQVSAAKVVLAYRDDGKELASAGVDRADGVFRFEFVPEGDYVIKTEDARDVVWESVKNTTGMFPPTLEKERLVTSYGTAEQPLLLRGEMSDVVLSVPEKSAKGAGTTAGAAGTGGR